MAAVTVAADVAALADVAAGRITTLIEGAIAKRGRAHVCLTGGSTPQRLYEQLADSGHPWRARIDWTHVHLYWGDERHVPPDHPESNYGMAARALLDRVPVPASQVHRIHAELPHAADAAREYEAQLPDVFDVMLLGLGEDAHIASLFPDGIVRGPGRVVAVWAPKLNAWRITLTPTPILAARTIVMLVAGADKADAVYAAIEAAEDVDRYPAQLLRAAEDRLEWLVDAAAAARLRPH
jgi:6-phosphogluconolactonase